MFKDNKYNIEKSKEWQCNGKKVHDLTLKSI